LPQDRAEFPPERMQASIPDAANLVPMEKELASIGFFLPSGHRIKDTRPRCIKLFQTISSSRCDTLVRIVPCPRHGFPVISDQDKYLALQKIITRSHNRQEPITNPITFHSSDLLSILGRRSDGGHHHQRIRDWFGVMTGTTIISDGAIWLAGSRKPVTGALKVFDHAIPSGERLSTGCKAERHYLWLSNWQLDNLNHHHAFGVDLEAYLRLRKFLSRALVPLLHVWLYASRHAGRFEKRYGDLCRHLNLRSYTHSSKIAEKLGPSLAELQNQGYLSGWAFRDTGGGCKITLHHGERFLSNQDPSSRGRNRRDDDLLPALVNRGITRAVARDLLAHLPECQNVMDQLEWGDFCISQSGCRIINPAGFYIHLIRSHIRPPASFETSRKRQLAEVQSVQLAQQAAEHSRLEQLYQEYRDRQVDIFIATHYSEEHYRALLLLKRQELFKRYPQAVYWEPSVLQRSLIEAVRTDVAKAISFVPA
jgi:hypothetical protein